jgi:uncharacterized protein
MERVDREVQGHRRRSGGDLFGSAAVSGGNWKEMFNAACEGDLALVAYHVQSGVDVNYAHPEFLATPLVASILAQQETVALFLLANGANPHLLSEFDGCTPMQAAHKAGLDKVAAKLIELGAQPPTVVAGRRSWLARLLRRR